MLRALLSLLFAGVASTAWSAVPAPRTVDVTAPDGAMLKATYYAAAAPGPARAAAAHVQHDTAVVGSRGPSAERRRHPCPGARLPRFRRQPWRALRRAAAGRAAEDRHRRVARRRGCGSGVPARAAWRGQGAHRCRRRQLRREPGRAAGPPPSRTSISLVLLAGRDRWRWAASSCSTRDGCRSSPPRPPTTSSTRRRRSRCSGWRSCPAIRATASSGSRMAGTAPEIFGPHPELARQIVERYADTLVKAPADPSVASRAKEHAGEDILGGARRAGWRRPGRADVS